MPHLAVGLDAGPVLTVQVLPVPIALAPPDLNAYGVQLEAPCLVGLNLLLKLWSNLKYKGCQCSKDLPGGEVPVKEALHAAVCPHSLAMSGQAVNTSGPLLSCPVESEAQEILIVIYKHCGLPSCTCLPIRGLHGSGF